MTALKQAVEKAFVFQNEAGIKQRIVVFTESIRTQQYMFEELSHAGYEGQILKFNGSTNDPVTKQIYKAWEQLHLSLLLLNEILWILMLRHRESRDMTL